MIELFIENKKVDVSSQFSTLLTYAIDDLKDFAARNSSYSKVMILPGTARNNLALGMIFDVLQSNPYDAEVRNIATNFNAAKKANAIIFQDNIQVFKGTFRLLKIIDDGGRIEYEGAVFGELGGLVATLGALKLENLDFSALDHIFNETNVVNSWLTRFNNTAYWYPMIDYANTSTNKHDWDIKTFRPALFVKDYIKKIFANSGYRLVAPILNTNRFRRLIVTSTRKESENTYVSNSFNGSFNDQVYIAAKNRQLVISRSNQVNFFSLSGNTLTWNNGNGFTTDHDINITINFDLAGSGTPPTSNIEFALQLFKGATLVSQVTDSIDFNQSTYAAQYNLSATAEATSNGDSFFVKATMLYANGDAVDRGITFEIIRSSWVINNSPAFLYPSAYGGLVQMNQTIPRNILQVDFISSIAKLFNLLIYEDPNEIRLLRITPYVEFYDLGGGPRLLNQDDTGILLINDSGDGLLIDNGDVNAVDWSYKLNRNRPIQITPMSEVNARFYDFTYKPDTDYWNDEYQRKYNEVYGSRRYDTEFDFSKDVEKCELIFSPTPLVQYNGDDKVMPAIYKGKPGTETSFEGNIRILQVRSQTCASWQLKNGVTVLRTLTDYGYAGHFNQPDTPSSDLNFGATQELFYPGVSTTNNQFNLYWSQYMAEITDKDSRLITAYFRLDEKDIAQLDFSKFIWIDGNLYRLNKIEDWNATFPDECRVELLKVIQTER